MAQKVGSLLVDVAMDVAKIDRQTKQLNRKFDKFGKDTSRALKPIGKAFDSIMKNWKQMALSMGTFVVGRGIVQQLKSIFLETTKAADGIAKFSERVGISVEALSEFHFAAERSGIEIRTFDMAVQRMTRRVAEAAVGTGEARAAIKELGLDAGALKDAGIDEALMMIADAMARVPSQADRVRLAMKLFDSEGVRMVQMLNNGSQGIRLLREEMRRYNAVVTKDFAAGSVKAQDALTNFGTAMNGLRLTLAEGVVPSMTEFIDRLTELAVFVSDKGPEIKTFFGILAAQLSSSVGQGGFGMPLGFFDTFVSLFRRQQRLIDEANVFRFKVDTQGRIVRPDTEIVPPHPDGTGIPPPPKGAKNVSLFLAEETTKQALEAYKSYTDQIAKATDWTAGHITNAFTSAFDAIFDKTVSFGDAMMGFLGNLARDIGQTVLHQMVSVPISSALVGSLPGLFGSFVGHTGGAVTPQGIKMHTGGEVPAILQSGEFVMSKAATSSIGTGNLSAMNRMHSGGPVGGGGGGGAVNMQININNETGVPMEAEVGDITKDMENHIANVVLHRRSRSRSYRQSMGG